MEMFCNQCQEASKGIGCTVFGVCGKSPELTALMDTFIYSLIGVSTLALEVETVSDEIHEFVMEGLFATITNANFEEEEFVTRTLQSLTYREELKEQLVGRELPILKHDIMNFIAKTKEEMIKKAL